MQVQKTNTMKSFRPVIAFLTLATVVSCGENKKIEDNNSPALNTESSSTLNQPVQTNETALKPSDSVKLPQVNNQVIGTASGKLNPAHGEPGHRCELAVGAPLDSSPAPATKVQTTTAPPVSMPAIETKPNQPAPANLKINPAHGEPGHRCDIAVGAPLNGTSSINKNINNITTTPTANITTTPSSITTNTNNQHSTTASNLKINPAHGQPGHRCDLAVGAPLDGTANAKTEVKTTSANPLQYYQPIPKVEPDKKVNTQTKEAGKKDTPSK